MAAPIGKVSIELEARFAKLESDIKKAASSMERQFSKLQGDVSSHFKKMESSAEKATANINKITSGIGKAINLGAITFVARELARMSDGFSNLTARVRLAAGQNANFAASLDSIKKVAMSTYSSLDATARLVQKVSQSLQNTGVGASESFRRATQLTEIFNKALVVSGAGAIQAEAAMLQFSQAIAKGKLDGDEFRSVMENNSRFMQLLADSIGVTFAELYRMREAGLLTNDMIMKVTENTAKLDAEFAKFPVTLQRASQNFMSAMEIYVGSTDSALGVSRSIAEAINLLAHNMELLGAATIAFAAVLANRYIASVVTASLMSRALAAELTAIGAASFVATSSLRAMGVALLAAVGGPVGVAIAAATAGIVGIGYAVATAVEQANEFKRTIDSIESVASESLDIELRIQMGEQFSSDALASQLEAVRNQANAIFPSLDRLEAEIDGLKGSVWKTADTFNRLNEAKREYNELIKLQMVLIAQAVGLQRRYNEAKEREAQNERASAIMKMLGEETEKTIQQMEKQRITMGATNVQLQEYERSVAILNMRKKVGRDLTKGETDEIVEQFKARISEAKLLDSALAAQEAMNEARKEAEKGIKKEQKALEELAEARVKNGEEAQRIFRASLSDSDRVVEDYIASLAEWGEKLRKSEVSTDDYRVAIEGLSVAFNKNSEEIDKNAAEQAALDDILGRVRQKLQEEADTFGLRGRELFVQNQLQDAMNMHLERFRTLVGFNADAVRELAGDHFDLGVAMDNSIAILERYEQTIVSAFQGGADAFGDMFSDIISGNASIEEAFENLGDSLINIIADSVGQMISEFLKLRVINPMLNSMFNGFGGNLLPMAQGASGGAGIIGSLLGGANTGGGLVGGLLGSTFGAVGGALAGFGGALGSFGAGLTIAGNAGLLAAGQFGVAQIAAGNLAVGMGAILPVIGAVAAAASAINAISGGRLFGTSYSPESSTSTLSVGAGGGQASTTVREVRQRSLFRGRQWRNRSIAPDSEAIAAAEQLFEAVRGVMIQSANALQGEAPAMLEAALRTVQEFDSKGKVIATKYFVDVLGRTWEEATSEAAAQRINAEAIIATIDSILGTIVDAASESIGNAGATAIATGIDNAVSGALDGAGMLTKTEQLMGEASAIAERWRDDAETLMDGASFLLAAATDIRAGTGLLGQDGTLTQIADLIESMQAPGESLVQTYVRVATATNLLSDAMELSGINLDMAREEFIRFATDIADAAGGIERAQQLWSTYFETFFTAAERAELARSRAQTNAESQFQDIGLDVNDFLGEGGMRNFRSAFDRVFESLSAEEVVEWLEAAEALGILNDAIAALGDTAGSAGTLDDGPLQDLMRQIKEEMMSFAPPQTFEQRMAAINAETQALVERAAALGASEAQLALIREVGIQRQNRLLEEQAAIIDAQVAAQQELGQYLANLEALSTSSGISPLTQELQRLRSEYQQHIDRINELAIASGRAGASQEELAVASNWYAAQLEMAAERLIQSGISLVQRLYGGTQAAGGSSSGSGSWVGGGSSSTGLSGVEQAVEDRYAREMELLKNLGEYLESLGLSNLSPLTPSERLQEAQSQYNEILMRAMGGDLDALGQLQGAANSYLGEAQSYYGGVGAYSGIFEGVQSQIRAILDRGPLNSPLPDAPPTEVTGIGGGGVTVEAGESFGELSELERMAIANELAIVLRDLIVLTGDSLVEVANQLGLDLREFVADLGVNLDDLTVETAVALTGIARTLGVELTDLGNSVGVDLGRLGDEQSLLNDALEQTVDSLPTEFRDRLRTYLEAIENATTEADANEAIQNAEDAINRMPAGIRDALAPFFGGVTSPGDVLLAEAVATTQNTARMNTLQEQANAFLESIAQNTLGDPPDLPPPDPIAPSVPDLVSNISADLRSPEANESDLVAEISALRSEVVSLRSAVAMASSKDVEAASRIESAIKSAPPGSRRQ